jgi:uncharacterized protein
VKIEFDAAKRDKTLVERGLDFADARPVFRGRHKIVLDDRKDYGEPRFITIGWLDGRMVVLVWTPMGAGRRIISMRKANAREQKAYADELKWPGRRAGPVDAGMARQVCCRSPARGLEDCPSRAAGSRKAEASRQSAAGRRSDCLLQGRRSRLANAHQRALAAGGEAAKGRRCQRRPEGQEASLTERHCLSQT